MRWPQASIQYLLDPLTGVLPWQGSYLGQLGSELWINALSISVQRLVATSCVEAGVDLSFKTGIREAASLVSLLQTAGRVNRHDHINAETVWTVVLKEEDLIKSNPAMRDSSKVLLELFATGNAISPDLCTDALKREIRMAGDFPDTLMKAEIGLRFPQVEKIFRVIEGDTRTVVVDQRLVEKLENHLPVDWRKIQKGAVQIWAYRLDKLRIPEIRAYPGIFKWVYDYDDFIGYMTGILKMSNDPHNFII